MNETIIKAIQDASGHNELRLFPRGQTWLARIHRVNGGFWIEGHGATADLALQALTDRINGV